MITLIGPMGAGKSSVGSRLAKRLQLPFIDLDAMIVARAGKSIPHIFRDDGQCVFRALEGECLQQCLSSAKHCVLATGGGVVMRAPNRQRLKDGGTVIWLDASPEILAQRTAGDTNRPLLHGVNPLQKARELDIQRRTYYQRCADFRINTANSTVTATVTGIMAFLNSNKE